MGAVIMAELVVVVARTTVGARPTTVLEMVGTNSRTPRPSLGELAMTAIGKRRSVAMLHELAGSERGRTSFRDLVGSNMVVSMHSGMVLDS